ncbi:MAG: hypothetical protein ACR2KJ_13945 [Jatrophihabitans sp.]
MNGQVDLRDREEAAAVRRRPAGVVERGVPGQVGGVGATWPDGCRTRRGNGYEIWSIARNLGADADGLGVIQPHAWEDLVDDRVHFVCADLTVDNDEFYRRIEDVLGRIPRTDLERDFFLAVLEKPAH